jgi:hypothetical protein
MSWSQFAKMLRQPALEYLVVSTGPGGAVVVGTIDHYYFSGIVVPPHAKDPMSRLGGGRISELEVFGPTPREIVFRWGCEEVVHAPDARTKRAINLLHRDLPARVDATLRLLVPGWTRPMRQREKDGPER